MVGPVVLAAASVDITPDRPVALGGYSAPEKRAQSQIIDSPLEANLVLFRWSGRHVLLLSVDCLFSGPDLAGDLLKASHCLKAGDRVLTLATHAHTAPMLDRRKPLLGSVDDVWYREVVSRLAAAVDLTFDRLMTGATVAVASATIDGSVNRRIHVRRPILHGRRLIWSGTIMGPNPAAPRAATCRSAIIQYGDGQVACVLVNWACHPADHPDHNRVSPDYVGVLRSEIRATLGDCPVLFLQGFSGDVRAAIPMKPTGKRLLRRCVRGPVFMVPTRQEWEDWARAVGSQVSAVNNTAARGPKRSLTRISLTNADLPLAFLLGAGVGGSCRASVLTIGDSVRLFMVTAEMSAAFASAVESLGMWPVSCLDDVFGYFPTDEQIQAGGYEVEEFQSAFNLPGRFLGRNDAGFRRLLENTTASGSLERTGQTRSRSDLAHMMAAPETASPVREV